MIVLDTHAWIWWTADPESLSPRARHTIEQSKEIGIAAISCWEVAMLVQKGRLEFDRDVLLWLQQSLAQPRCTLVSATPDIAVAAAQFTDFAGDPADRIIVATTLAYHAQLVTKDRALRLDTRVVTIW